MYDISDIIKENPTALGDIFSSSQYPELPTMLRGLNTGIRTATNETFICNQCYYPPSKDEIDQYLNIIPDNMAIFTLTFGSNESSQMVLTRFFSHILNAAPNFGLNLSATNYLTLIQAYTFIHENIGFSTKILTINLGIEMNSTSRLFLSMDKDRLKTLKE